MVLCEQQSPVVSWYILTVSRYYQSLLDVLKAL
jgi:hypothetical protein